MGKFGFAVARHGLGNSITIFLVFTRALQYMDYSILIYLYTQVKKLSLRRVK